MVCARGTRRAASRRRARQAERCRRLASALRDAVALWRWIRLAAHRGSDLHADATSHRAERLMRGAGSLAPSRLGILPIATALVSALALCSAVAYLLAPARVALAVEVQVDSTTRV